MPSRFLPSGLRPRLMLLIAFVVTGCSVLVVRQALHQREAAIRAAASEAALMCRLAAADEERAVEVVRHALVDLAGSAPVRGGDAAATQRLLEYLRVGAGPGHLAVAAPDGRLFASTRAGEAGADASGSEWFREAVRIGEFAIGAHAGGPGEGRGVLRCALPATDPDGRLLAVASAELPGDWLRRAALRARLPEDAALILVDHAGVLRDGFPPPAGGAGDSVIALSRGGAREWAQRVRGGDGRIRLVAFTVLANHAPSRLLLGVGIDEAATVAGATRTFARSLALLLAVGLAVAAAAWFGVQAAVVSRVDALIAATARLRAGDLSARTNAPAGGGELDQLARAFDEMAAGLQQQGAIREQAERQLRASEAHKSAVLESSIDGILVLDAQGHVIECNAAARRLFGCCGTRCVHHRAADLFGGFEMPSPARHEPPARPTEAEGRRMDGSTFPVEVGLAPIRDRSGSRLFVATVRDLTERKRWERSIEALTFVDDLTGLYNRRGFSMFASQQVRLAARTHQSVVLVSIDLDGLKAINDTFGHGEGDRAILELAVILRRSFRESDVVARFGGDEFVALATETEGAGAESVLERLAERIALRNERGDLPWRLSASFGWTRIEAQASPPLADLLAVADARMYEAKRAGRAGRAGAAGAPPPRPFAYPASVVEREALQRRPA